MRSVVGVRSEVRSKSEVRMHSFGTIAIKNLLALCLAEITTLFHPYCISRSVLNQIGIFSMKDFR